MEIPSSAAGVVKELRSPGRQGRQGSLVILTVESADAAAPGAWPWRLPPQPRLSRPWSPLRLLPVTSGSSDAEYDVVVLGGGPAVTRPPSAPRTWA